MPTHGPTNPVEPFRPGGALAETLATFCVAAEQSGDGETVCVLVLDDQGRQFTLGIAPNLAGELLNALVHTTPASAATSVAQAIDHGGAVFTPDIAIDPGWRKLSDQADKSGVRACVARPIIAESGTVLGVVAFFNAETQSPTEEQFTRLEAAANAASWLIERNWMTPVINPYAAAMRASMDGMAVVAEDGELVFVNRPLAEIFGYGDPEELAGRNWREVFSEDGIGVIEDDVLPGLNTQANWRGEITVRTRDGSKRQLEVSLTRAEDGRLLCVCRGTGEGAAARPAIDGDAAQFHQLAETSFDAVLVLENGLIVDANLAAAELFGLPMSSLIGMDGALLAAPEHRPDIEEKIRTNAHGVYESVGRRPDGGTFPAEVSAQTAERDGRSIRITAIRDISVRKDAEAALRESEERYRTLLNISPDAIYVHTGGKVVLANPAAIRLLGAECEAQLIGTELTDLVHPDHYDILRDRLARAGEASMQTLATEQRRLRLDGSEFIADVTATPLVWKGEHGGLAIVRDITERRRAEELVRKQSLAIAATTDGIGILDDHGYVVYANAAQAANFGLDGPDQLAGRHWKSLFDAEDVRDAESSVYRGLEETGTWSREMIAGHRDGSRRDVDVSLTRIDGGGYICICRDITERKIRDEADRKRKAQLTLAQGVARLGFWEWDLERKEFIWSDETRAMFGIDRPGFGDSYDDFLRIVHPDDHAFVRRALEKTVSEHCPFSVRHRIIRPDGAEIYVQVDAEVEFDASGRLTRLAGAVQDVTELWHAEQVLRESEQRLRSISDNIPGMVFQRLMHPDGRMEYPYLSDGVKEVTGFDRDAVMSTPSILFDIIHPDDIVGFKTALRQSADTLEPMTADFRIETKGGDKKWLRLISRPHKRDDQAIIWDSMVFDITDRKNAEGALAEGEAHLHRHLLELQDTKERLEARTAELMHTAEQLEKSRDAAEAANRAKSDFLATMSHEIRTPMNGVLGMAGLILDTELTDQQREYAATIRDCGDALLTIINDILDFSKMEAGKLDMEEVEFRPLEVIDSVAHVLGGDALEKGLDFPIFVSLEVPYMLVGDAGRLRQVLMNLVSNGIKFTDLGAVSLGVTLDSEDETSVFLRIDVTDTGIGISDDAQGKLFRRFTQADASTTRRFGGTGLGLAICKQLSEMMGGTIDFRSKPGAGSTFTATARLAKPQNRADPIAKLARGLSGTRVLVVDDGEINRAALCRQLESWGLRAEQSAGAGAAIDMLRRAADAGRPFDTALIDHIMPETNGLALSAKIRNQPELADTKLVLMTASGIEDLVDVVDKAGIASCLHKPVRPSALLNVLSDLYGAAHGETGKVGPSAPALVVDDAPREMGSRGLQILVAEDNAVSERVTMAMLLRGGHTVDTVSNGFEAVDAVAAKTYDAVLMDVTMPELDGVAATERIRNLAGPGANVPIIALTANAMPGDRDRYLAAGMNDYVSKPIDPKSLAAALTRCCGTKTDLTTPIAPPPEGDPAAAQYDPGDVTALMNYLDGIQGAD